MNAERRWEKVQSQGMTPSLSPVPRTLPFLKELSGRLRYKFWHQQDRLEVSQQ